MSRARGTVDVDRWAYENGVELDFSHRGTPTDNVVVESFNRRLRQECLNEHWFLSLADGQSKISAWRMFYNEDRPHAALVWKTPEEFARECGAQASLQATKKVESLPIDGAGIGGGFSRRIN
jgi:putative transposase